MAKHNPSEVAEQVHSAAIRLLRRLRTADTESALSAPKLSALSILAFAGPRTLSQLAQAEQVRAPTMSKLVADLVAEGLASKRADGADARVVHVHLTAKGREAMEKARARRLALLRAQFEAYSGDELEVLAKAATLMRRAAEAKSPSR
jgi:DNA-binding MarR family transcriptional regulator